MSARGALQRPEAIPLVDLQGQYLAIREEIDGAIARVIARASFILGEEVAAFEEEFAAYCGARWCVACANGTDALELALEAVGVGAGDEVITVAHTFIATAEAITSRGARPVFVDVRDDTLLMDVAAVERAITPRTRAVVPVHLYGQTVEMAPLLELARRHGLKVVEDAAQAHGAHAAGQGAGTFGDAAAFSFYPGKNLGAYGDAGAVVTSDAAVAGRVRQARDHGRCSKYEHDFPGRNSRMDGIQGAVLRVKLRHLEDWNRTRRELAARYDRLLAEVAEVRPVVVPPGCEPSRHLYVVRVPRRDRVLAALRGLGIQAGVHYPVPLHRQRAYADLGLVAGTLPITERAAAEVLSLPLYAPMEAALADRSAAALIEALAATREPAEVGL
jgi:dTDP-4-amino-4,6-dideoxygalactose transaminase